MTRGQALIEFALVAPLLLLLLLATIESGMLVASKGSQDRSTATLAQWAAYHPSEVPGPSWDAVVAVELPGCTVTVEYPEADVLAVASECQYAPIATRGLWAGLPISSSESAAVEPTASAAR